MHARRMKLCAVELHSIEYILGNNSIMSELRGRVCSSSVIVVVARYENQHFPLQDNRFAMCFSLCFLVEQNCAFSLNFSAKYFSLLF